MGRAKDAIAASEFLHRTTNTAAEVGHYRTRLRLKPVTIQEFAEPADAVYH
ncbi:MAG: hypothetical protein HRT36_01750 [Alphaproteobacteria bacterium]|nr:hypothetical protein [Alphaproteobacteria bacterium]